jgi:hypothetical protein
MICKKNNWKVGLVYIFDARVSASTVLQSPSSRFLVDKNFYLCIHACSNYNVILDDASLLASC